MNIPQNIIELGQFEIFEINHLVQEYHLNNKLIMVLLFTTKEL